jgi:hypothetical protein
MWKVISPVERNNSTYWMRLGTGFTNKDDSINVYLDAVPVPSKDGSVKLQIRELTEEELRSNAEKRASRSPGAGSASMSPSANQEIPF